jgi:hypothetical protein
MMVHCSTSNLSGQRHSLAICCANCPLSGEMGTGDGPLSQQHGIYSNSVSDPFVGPDLVHALL